MAFGGERISLTFRRIATWVDETEGVIWGQGATSKSRRGAKRVLEGEEAGREGERMISAFARENHDSQHWDWDRVYGDGFDVVDWNREKEREREREREGERVDKDVGQQESMR